MLFFSSSVCLNIFKILKKIRNTSSVSNNLDADQARLLVGSDLGPNCLQRLSADDTSS